MCAARTILSGRKYYFLSSRKQHHANESATSGATSLIEARMAPAPEKRPNFMRKGEM